MESTSGSTTNLNNHLKACLKRPRDLSKIPEDQEDVSRLSTVFEAQEKT
ncbi:hypothetical protein ES332_D04G107400v1 [Gossypium tomentosum]|uniref:BED-type domain-containing protein n=1 Tax=Gossypium tomentosum TaxID=34277 RepID=A0A5D2LCM3_GOSTO|nr:hypothetical protein ES332_D04G107400v1 [Gossypium tomentosum]